MREEEREEALTREPNGEGCTGPPHLPSLISTVMARETTSREARSLAVGA